jgi:transcriptional regulator GlxA family with amidase domain
LRAGFEPKENFMAMKRRASFLLAAVLAVCCFAQAPVKVAVKYNVQDEDRVGSKLIYKVKENFRASNGMALTPQEANADVQVEIITLLIPAASGEASAPSTAYSVLYTFTARPSSYKAVMYHSIGLCDESSVGDIAEGIVVKTDQLIQTFKVVGKK